MNLLSKALFGAIILFIFFNPLNVLSQGDDCDPMIGHVENLDATSGVQPANAVIVYAGQSFKAPTEGATVDGIKVFFSFIKEGAILPLTLHQGTTPGTITPAIATASFINSGANISSNSSQSTTGFPICFDFDSPVNLTSGGDYYWLVGTGCNLPIGCSFGLKSSISGNPYPDGNAFTASATSTGSRTWDFRFSVYSGDCDDEAPNAVANNITINVGNTGTTSLTQVDIDAIAAGTTDNCPNFLTYEITNGQTAFSCNDDRRSFRVTLTAMDACKNVDTESAIITVNCKDPSPLTLESGNQLNFSDPCSCDDPLNCDIMGVTYFHDTLVVTAAGATGLSITTVAGSTDFFTDVPCSGGALTPIPTGTLIPETPAGSGIYKLEFWRPSGSVPTLSVVEAGTVTAVPVATFDPACFQDECNPIPTMSQWTLLILAMLMSIMALVYLKRRESVIG